MTDENGDGAMSPRQRVGEGEGPDDAGLSFAPLAGLAVHDVGGAAATRIRRRALTALRQEERLAAHPMAAKAALWYQRALEPALLIGLGLGYCAWAAAGALAVLH